MKPPSLVCDSMTFGANPAQFMSISYIINIVIGFFRAGCGVIWMKVCGKWYFRTWSEDGCLFLLSEAVLTSWKFFDLDKSSTILKKSLESSSVLVEVLQSRESAWNFKDSSSDFINLNIKAFILMEVFETSLKPPRTPLKFLNQDFRALQSRWEF